MPVSGRNKVIGETSLYMPPKPAAIPLVPHSAEPIESIVEKPSRWARIKNFIKKILFYKIF